MIRTAAGFREATDARRRGGDTIGFVPTMGSLHEGHAALVRRARTEHPCVTVSIFVNPEQFAPGEDFESYPRDEAHDVAYCDELGVDVVWIPPLEEMYPPGVGLLEPNPGPIGDVLEGDSRPGHFLGVLKALHRLFDVAGPSTAYFGEKDAQQLFLVRRMVRELALPVSVVACPTVREPDGLALASRNSYLSPDERAQATCLFLALSEAAELSRSGERDAAVLIASMAREIGATPLATLDYAAVVDEATFVAIRSIERPVRALVAARFPSARLIDNLLLPSGAPVGEDGPVPQEA